LWQTFSWDLRICSFDLLSPHPPPAPPPGAWPLISSSSLAGESLSSGREARRFALHFIIRKILLNRAGFKIASPSRWFFLGQAPLFALSKRHLQNCCFGSKRHSLQWAPRAVKRAGVPGVPLNAGEAWILGFRKIRSHRSKDDRLADCFSGYIPLRLFCDFRKCHRTFDY
jgi:hypothetical protein